MAIAYARCPRCGFSCADLWRVREVDEHLIESLICRSCAFDWTITEPLDFADGKRIATRLVLVYSRARDT
jgi:hypothetical protein